MLKLKLQYFGHLMWRVDLLEKTDAGKDWWQRRMGQQRMRWLDSITDSTDMNLSKLWEIAKESLACCSPWGRRELNTSYRLNSNSVERMERHVIHPLSVSGYLDRVQCLVLVHTAPRTFLSRSSGGNPELWGRWTPSFIRQSLFIVGAVLMVYPKLCHGDHFISLFFGSPSLRPQGFSWKLSWNLSWNQLVLQILIHVFPHGCHGSRAVDTIAKTHSGCPAGWGFTVQGCGRGQTLMSPESWRLEVMVPPAVSWLPRGGGFTSQGHVVLCLGKTL